MTEDKELAESVLNCIAHGAGRKLSRSSAQSSLSKKYRKEELLKTKLGSEVVCHSKSLLYQEAPEAYKDIGNVIKDLQDYKLIKL